MDLSYLRPLFAGDGPWASVYLDATGDVRSPGPGLDARWQTLAQQLVDLKVLSKAAAPEEAFTSLARLGGTASKN